MSELIDSVAVIDALGCCAVSRLITLVHRIQAQIAGLALGLRLAPLPIYTVLGGVLT